MTQSAQQTQESLLAEANALRWEMGEEYHDELMEDLQMRPHTTWP
jgi:hypothetical protein